MIPKKQDIIISDRTEGMVESSASYYQESQLFFYIINAKARGYDLVNEKQDDLALQLSPLTATWGLVFWEQSVGLPMLPNGDYATRRPKVLARLQNYENFGAPMIHRIAEAYGEKINLEVYDKASNGFKVRNLGSAKSVSFTWTIINTNIQ